ncbi:MAG: hypothetical protein ABL955_06710 [Elusimicrobiota bacterium]
MKRSTSFWCAAAVLGLSAALLFFRLGHYALWDDEAGTALTAQGVLATGDTSAVLGHNVFAYNGGAELEGLRLRYMPPLQAYLAAPFLAAFGRDSALAARLPFALCALALVLLMLHWLRRTGADATSWFVFAVALLSNASFFLYGRQARYYAPAMLCTAAVAYLYVFWNGSRRRLAAIGLWSIALLALNYLSFAALYLCLAADYALWGRKSRPLSRNQWAILFVPQLVAAVVLLSIWNPLGKHVMDTVSGAWWNDTAASIWFSFRDMHRCEFLSLPLLVAAPFLSRSSRNLWLVRAPLAVLVYVVAIACLAPLPATTLRVAQVRYLAPLLPLGFAVAVLCARAVPERMRRIAVPLSLVLFCAHLLTARDFVRELALAPDDPYRGAARWINANVREGESVWVTPDHMAYPLMFHAPKAVYAWQLTSPAQAQFEQLPLIHFRGRVPPDYAVVFGPGAETVLKDLNAWQGSKARYARVATLDIFWRDLYRPELFWRSFGPVTGYDQNSQAISVLQRIQSPRADRL